MSKPIGRRMRESLSDLVSEMLRMYLNSEKSPLNVARFLALVDWHSATLEEMALMDLATHLREAMGEEEEVLPA